MNSFPAHVSADSAHVSADLSRARICPLRQGEPVGMCITELFVLWEEAGGIKVLKFSPSKNRCLELKTSQMPYLADVLGLHTAYWLPATIAVAMALQMRLSHMSPAESGSTV